MSMHERCILQEYVRTELFQVEQLFSGGKPCMAMRFEIMPNSSDIYRDHLYICGRMTGMRKQ